MKPRINNLCRVMLLIPLMGMTLHAQDPVDFARDVRPILAEHCFACHGPDAGKRKANLRLDTLKGATRDLGGTRAVVPGRPGRSELIRRVLSEDEDDLMPPPKAKKPLTAEQIEILRRWISQGADFSEHWAYRPLVRPGRPFVSPNSWVRGPLDAFVFQKLASGGHVPSPEADRYTLINRLYDDLLGIPPTPEEADAFVRDTSPRAYGKLVDRLLASPRFGERWGRHWLDKARYADSDGYEKDNARPNAWRWRDWVIDAINADVPFDRFTELQLAGDLLPDVNQDSRLATAFHRQTLTNTEGGVNQEQWRVAAVMDRAETTGSLWLGLTVGCARCHDHKYDRISQEEYYQLYAFFDNADEASTRVIRSEDELESYEKNKVAHEKETARLEKLFASTRKNLAPAQRRWEKKTRGLFRKRKDELVRFVSLNIVEARSDEGTPLERLPDGSWKAGGKNPRLDRYVLTVETDQPVITGFRFWALRDPGFPAKGPGRAPNGNFVLTDFEVRPQKEGSEAIPLVEPVADFNQKGWHVKGAVDDKPQTGWAVMPQFGRDHQFVVKTKDPAGVGGMQRFTVVLDQQHNGEYHNIGRFRLDARVGTLEPPVSDTLRAALDVAPAKRTAAQKKGLFEAFSRHNRKLAALVKKRQGHKTKTPKYPDMAVRVLKERGMKKRRKTAILERGDFTRRGDPVSTGLPATLPPIRSRMGGEVPPDRLDLAWWIFSKKNPLAPRVAANHVWRHLFGRGLVSTLDDFGVRGAQPTHPRLLDWLATEYRRLGWSRKKFIRTIVMSATYRQSSHHRPEMSGIDPSNNLLHRQNRFRVEAEIIRDRTLDTAGLLSDRVGGASVFPPVSRDILALTYNSSIRWKVSTGADRWRRGLYTFFKRTAPDPNLMAFDCPDSNVACLERRRSNTPIGALVTLNNEVFMEGAQGLARRVLSEEHEDDHARLARAFRLCLVRPPQAGELVPLQRVLRRGREFYGGHSEESTAVVGNFAVEGVASAENAAWIATVRVLLNLDEFLTRD